MIKARIKKVKSIKIEETITAIAMMKNNNNN